MTWSNSTASHKPLPLDFISYVHILNSKPAWPHAKKSHHWTCCCMSPAIWYLWVPKLASPTVNSSIFPFPSIPPCMSTIYWSSHITVGGCGAEEGSLLWFALSLSAIQDLISVWLPRTMGNNMCSWMCCKPVRVNHQHPHPTPVFLALQLKTASCLMTVPCLLWIHVWMRICLSIYFLTNCGSLLQSANLYTKLLCWYRFFFFVITLFAWTLSCCMSCWG